MAIDYSKLTPEVMYKEVQRLSTINENIDSFLSTEKDKLTKELNPLYQQLTAKDFNQLIDLQAAILSLRHRIVDFITVYLNKLSKEIAKIKKVKSDRMMYYLTGFGIKIGSTQITSLIDSDLAEHDRGIKLLETYIEYLRECKQSCDQVGYSVKNRIELLRYQTAV